MIISVMCGRAFEASAEHICPRQKDLGEVGDG